ncbi:hypothetical protein PRIPAC_87772 [Pristionchus pacificus]|uniref:Uncharacterized protein n=1 Tax=Pristionchus pacificus TaxID=54126 RepID=A0A454XPX1_PRIPA|nr:hypothetical protein PRIPAC_87772 [Pristionchus pacificus]|eukprot:PDM82752.1 hypothetical protein PRIPAC_37145 [Pristionchus pacificus]
MARSMFFVCILLLVISATMAIRELDESKTWLECMTVCLDTPAIRNAVPSCTLTCKNIFSNQFSTGRPISRG